MDKGVFRTLINNYDGAFLRKILRNYNCTKATKEMLDRVFNIPLIKNFGNFSIFLTKRYGANK